MGSLRVRVSGGGGPIVEQITDLKADVTNLSAFLDHVADTIVYPALARNYDQSGLKFHRGVVKAAVSTRGAKGNMLVVQGGHLEIGVDYGAVPEAKFAIEGRRAFRARAGKTLRFFDDNGKPVFTKSVRAAHPHEIFYLTDADITRIQEAAAAWVAEGG